jgi:predicted porin
MHTKVGLAVSLGLACGVAFADATIKIDDTKSVSLWGRLVGGVEYLSDTGNGSSKSSAGQQWGTSLFGVKGQQDLGGGREASFLLEQGFGSQSGVWNGDRMWQRASWLGIKDKEFGMLRIGNGSFINNYVWGFDPLYLEDYSASTFSNFRNGPRLANGLRYESPSFGGVEFAVQLNHGGNGLDKVEGAEISKKNPDGNPTLNYGQAWGFTVAYKQPQYEIRLIHDSIRDANGQMTDVLDTSSETFVGYKYKLSPETTLKTGYAHYGASDALAGTAKEADHVWVGVNHMYNSRLELQGALYNMKIGDGAGTVGGGKFNAGGQGTMVALGGMYYLSPTSKDTFFYANLARVHNASGGNFTVRPADKMSQSGLGQTGINAGFVHNF